LLFVRFVIGIRSDYFSHLATFQCHLPHIFHNEYYLQPMTRKEAQAAITGPVAKLDRPVVYEKALLDTLLDDLARGGIELPHLQIICTRLYEALTTEKTSIPLALYERLGYAEGVLGSYLIKVLDKLPGSEAVIAKRVLKELISSKATRRVLAYDILMARVEAKRNELDDVLARLVHARLLRRGEVAGEITYEVVHEYLIREIKTWVDQRDLELKQVEELLARETVSWRTHGTPIPRDRLELLYTQRERLKGLNDETWKCILQSALEADSSVLDWVRQAGDVGKRHLLKALSDTDVEKCKRVARVLGQLGDPCAAEPLATTLRDKDHKVRRVACEALIKIGPPSVDPLIAALQDGRCHDTRFLAADALGAIGETRAIEPLIAVLEDNGELEPIRQAAARALGKLNDPKAIEALVAALRVQDRDVYQTVVEILGQIGELAASSLIAALEEESASVRQAAVTLLAGSRNLCAVRGLVNALGDKDIKVRRAAAGALAKTGRPAVEPLIATLHDRRRDVRWAAARVLGKIGDSRAIEPLVVALEDKSEHVRFAAAGALEKIGTPAALSALSAVDDLRQKESEDI
jgi:HEAT repeat protein